MKILVPKKFLISKTPESKITGTIMHGSKQTQMMKMIKELLIGNQH